MHLLRRHFVACALLAGGCASNATLTRQSDAIVDDIIGGSGERLNDARRATVEKPKPREPAPSPEVSALAPPAPSSDSRTLSLTNALEIAVATNREYIGQEEDLYQQALSLYGVRHGYSTLVTSTLNYVFASGTGSDVTGNTSLGVGVSRKLPWGGSVSAGLDTSHAQSADSDPDTFTTGASIGMVQPLLRGFGREIGMESLVQAERSLMYRIRDFELFRENFSIQVAQRYYGLVQQKRGLDNQRRTLEDVIFARRQAEAVFSLGDVNELDVLRARRSELTAQNDLIEAEETFRRALDSFRIFLGLPQGVRVDVADEAPVFVEVAYDVDSAVEVAFKNRLDVLNRRQQLEDSARALRIAENGTLPDVTLNLSYGLGGDSDASFARQTLDDGSFSASINASLPIDRTSERASLRNAQISHRQAVRGYDQFEQELVVDIQSTFRGLERRKQSLSTQRQLITDQERMVKIAQLRFEQGDFSNRDVVEAQQALLVARNALIQEQVDYEIARLQLIRDLGILFVDEHGMWKE